MSATVRAPDLYPEKKSRFVKRYEKRVRELTAIKLDVALIALDVGISEYSVCLIQRKLGLRALCSRGNHGNQSNRRHIPHVR